MSVRGEKRKKNSFERGKKELEGEGLSVWDKSDRGRGYGKGRRRDGRGETYGIKDEGKGSEGKRS